MPDKNIVYITSCCSFENYIVRLKVFETFKKRCLSNLMKLVIIIRFASQIDFFKLNI